MHVEAWRAGIGKLVGRGVYSPATANGWLAILRHVLKRAKCELRLSFDASEGIPAFDTSEHPTYTEEEPNALTSEEAAAFVARMKDEFPAQYAMAFLGFATGLRPSTLRPLRRGGATPDILWDEGVVLVRRSHTIGDEFMNTTKTKLRQRITVPPEVMDVLRWHVAAQLTTPEQKASELLFPAGGRGLSIGIVPQEGVRNGRATDRLEQDVHAERDAPDVQRPDAAGEGGGDRHQVDLRPPDRPHARALLHGHARRAAAEHQQRRESLRPPTKWGGQWGGYPGEWGG
jgi:hypothetical protein